MSLRTPPSHKKTFRVNKEIQTSEVRLIDEKGEQAGIVSTQKALEMAENVGLDLIEISPNVSPPVCKILDVSKYKYEQQRKLSQQRRNQKTITIKEIKLRPTIDTNDFNIRLKNARRWIADGHKVKITLRYRGREVSHSENGRKLFYTFLEELDGLVKVDQPLQREDRTLSMLLSPLTGVKEAKPKAGSNQN